LRHLYVTQLENADGLRWRERVLRTPDRAGCLAGITLGTTNLANRFRLHRILLGKVLGIHRDKLLPDFAGTTFEKWAVRAGKVKPETGGEVVLFQTCYVQNNEPQIGRDTVEVLERNGVDVRCVRGLQCCGMPAWEQGDLAS